MLTSTCTSECTEVMTFESCVYGMGQAGSPWFLQAINDMPTELHGVHERGAQVWLLSWDSYAHLWWSLSHYKYLFEILADSYFSLKCYVWPKLDIYVCECENVRLLLVYIEVIIFFYERKAKSFHIIHWCLLFHHTSGQNWPFKSGLCMHSEIMMMSQEEWGEETMSALTSCRSLDDFTLDEDNQALRSLFYILLLSP